MPLAAHRFTVDEYHRMGEAGVFHEDDRVELVDGQIVEMSPIGVSHAACVTRLNQAFAALAARGRATVGVQNPAVLGRHEEPQPDIAVLHYRRDGYGEAHPGPGDVFLLVEVADSSLGYDRGTKLPLYARSGVPEVWLVNLPGDVVEVFRQPREGRYRDERTARRGETIAPLAFPDLELRCDDILGLREG
jgi:Uma2 family endonuclease